MHVNTLHIVCCHDIDMFGTINFWASLDFTVGETFRSALLMSFALRRHRRTEEEEDEELLSDARQTSTAITRFDESPSCKQCSV